MCTRGARSRISLRAKQHSPRRAHPPSTCDESDMQPSDLEARLCFSRVKPILAHNGAKRCCGLWPSFDQPVAILRPELEGNVQEVDIVEILRGQVARAALAEHSTLMAAQRGKLSFAQTGVMLGQWWHPLHYFPSFIGRSISVLPFRDGKTALSRILFQELGEGDPKRAHEAIFVATMTEAGFEEPVLTDAAPLPATAALIKGYESASTDALSALAFIFATEVVDLAMVSGIGAAVRHATGRAQLEWVDIHVAQEPEHVEKVETALGAQFAPGEVDVILRHADHMWRLWSNFFTAIGEETAKAAPKKSLR